MERAVKRSRANANALNAAFSQHFSQNEWKRPALGYTKAAFVQQKASPVKVKVGHLFPAFVENLK